MYIYIYFKRTISCSFPSIETYYFLFKEITWITKYSCVKSIYIYIVYIVYKVCIYIYC